MHTLTAPRTWWRLDRHDVRSTLPASIQPIMQNGLLERTFEDALLPEFLFPAVADNEPWSGGLGDTQIMTRTGLLVPQTTPITGSDASTGTYSVEQWQVTMDQYGFAMDTNMLQSAMTLASKYLRDVQTIAINAGQSLNQLARNKLFAAYGGGRTWVTTAQGSASTTCVVNDPAGFGFVMVNGVATAVSGTNPLSVTVNGVANTVTAVNVGTKTLTLGTAVIQAIGDAVVSGNGPVSFRAGSRVSRYALTSADTATLALYRNAVTRLRKQNVPTVNGNYVAHITPDTVNQLFGDADFKQAYQGRADSEAYRNLSMGTFAGLDWVINNETPTTADGGTAANLNVARTLVLGQGALVGAPFSEMASLLSGSGVEGVPSIRTVGPATGVQVALIVRPPTDRLQQLLSTAWSWVGDFGVPSDITASGNDPSRFKRACVVEHVF